MSKEVYHTRITDTERRLMEEGAFDLWLKTGQPMRIPPKLFEDLKNGGVSMKYMLADPSLEQ